MITNRNALSIGRKRDIFKTDEIMYRLILEILKSQGEIAKSLPAGDSQKIYLPNDAAGFFGSWHGGGSTDRFGYTWKIRQWGQ